MYISRAILYVPGLLEPGTIDKRSEPWHQVTRTSALAPIRTPALYAKAITSTVIHKQPGSLNLSGNWQRTRNPPGHSRYTEYFTLSHPRDGRTMEPITRQQLTRLYQELHKIERDLNHALLSTSERDFTRALYRDIQHSISKIEGNPNHEN